MKLIRHRNARAALTMLAPLCLGACTMLQDVLPDYSAAGRQPVDVTRLPVEEPIDPHRFRIDSPQQSVVGIPQVVLAGHGDTLSDLARAYGLGRDEIIAANPGVDPWLPGEGTPILLPTQHVLPDVPRRGIVLNIAAKRLYYFPSTDIEQDPQSGSKWSRTVLTYPMGIGRVGWETPTGATSVVAKAKNPTWWVPASVRKEHAAKGDPLPAVVPPGPDNPLGTRVLKLGLPGYLIHGTNKPYGVGMRVSHGCVRLYPENIQFLYDLVAVGEPVVIINEPYLLGQREGEWFLEAHTPLEDDTVGPEVRLASTLTAIDATAGVAETDHIHGIIASALGTPIRLDARSQDELRLRLRRVRNTVVADPQAPTVASLRAMLDEASGEAASTTGGG